MIFKVLKDKEKVDEYVNQWEILAETWKLLKKNQIEMLKVKNKIKEVKSSLDGQTRSNKGKNQ